MMKMHFLESIFYMRPELLRIGEAITFSNKKQ